MNYTRIFTDANGETHFEDVEPPVCLTPSEVSAGASDLSAPIAVRELRFRRVAVAHERHRPHVAPRRQFMVQLTGDCEVEVSDGELRRFGPGSVILVEDTWGKGHTTRELGETPRQSLFIHLDSA